MEQQHKEQRRVTRPEDDQHNQNTEQTEAYETGQEQQEGRWRPTHNTDGIKLTNNQHSYFYCFIFQAHYFSLYVGEAPSLLWFKSIMWRLQHFQSTQINLLMIQPGEHQPSPTFPSISTSNYLQHKILFNRLRPTTDNLFWFNLILKRLLYQHGNRCCDGGLNNIWGHNNLWVLFTTAKTEGNDMGAIWIPANSRKSGVGWVMQYASGAETKSNPAATRPTCVVSTDLPTLSSLSSPEGYKSTFLYFINKDVRSEEPLLPKTLETCCPTLEGSLQDLLLCADVKRKPHCRNLLCNQQMWRCFNISGIRNRIFYCSDLCGLKEFQAVWYFSFAVGRWYLYRDFVSSREIEGSSRQRVAILASDWPILPRACRWLTPLESPSALWEAASRPGVAANVACNPEETS